MGTPPTRREPSGQLTVMLSRVGAADGPILIAFDGSPASRCAVSDAASLFGERAALVVTVWEPGLAYAMPQMGTELVPAPMVDPATALSIDEGVHSQAEQVAGEGAELARSLGLDAHRLERRPIYL